jgi:N-acetyl-gamma-glutamyl-phosphate reductase
MSLGPDPVELELPMTANSVSVGILGATGYTGIELLRLLHDHPFARVDCMTSDRFAGQPIDAVFPHLRGRDLPALSKIGDHDLGSLDAVFGCLPHGTTQDVIRELPRGPKVIDLSADFRLRDPEAYERTYGQPHRALLRQKDAVYGLTEQARPAIRATDLVANPGCYPTTAQLPLWPLLKARLIDPDDIVIDAKSGVTGAGRAAKESSLFAEVSEGLHAYGVSTHRHTPEIEQGLSDAAGRPINRGILATIYVRLVPGADVQTVQAELERSYEGEPFARVLSFRSLPSTRHVRSTNACLMAVHPGRTPDRAILLSVTDNLVKGASGQALQNMNLMLGLQETAGLEQPALFP